ncbi:MAG: hypothetical protein FWH04_05695 [Oscillospiraceae bacterium]|nr:hypothetical protein [Oscillospiraceae bacterium]
MWTQIEYKIFSEIGYYTLAKLVLIDEKTNELVISGCPNGIDWSVQRENNIVTLTTSSNMQTTISFEQYRDAVFEFADKIKSFYEKCSPKLPPSDFEGTAQQRFWADWERLRTQIKHD